MAFARRPHVGPLVHRLFTRPVAGPLHVRRPMAAFVGVGDRLQLTWLGAAGLRLCYDGYTLLVDPYLSRPGLRRSLRSRLVSDRALVRRHVDRADAVITTHSHHDHLLDVPEIVRLTGARVVGDASSCNYLRACGVPHHRIDQVSAPARVELGPFDVTIRPSAHVDVGFSGPPPGTMAPTVKPPLHMRQFRCQEVFALHIRLRGGAADGMTLFHLGSASFLPETIDKLACDVLLPALVGRKQRHRFLAELTGTLKPKLLIPIHFDDFFAPLSRPLRQLPGADLEGFLAELNLVAPACRPLLLDLLGTVELPLGPPAETPGPHLTPAV